MSAPFATAPAAPAAGPPGPPTPFRQPGPLVPTGRSGPPVRPPRRRTVPQALRLWAAALVTLSAALLTMTIVGFARLTSQVDTIGAEAAPQAATASDIYFALSDLDAQAATLLMLGDAQSLSLNRLTALATFEQRTAEVDADLAQANRGATDAAQRARLGRIADELSLYRQWVWRAIDAQQGSVTAAPVDAVPPPSASLGLYAEATTVLRNGLLPDVEALRQTNEDRLDAAYASLKTTAVLSIIGVLVLGVLLVVALVRFQFRLSRLFRRTVNPALLVATVAVATLVATSSVAFLDGSVRMHDAQRDQFAPYLSLTRLQAVSYDAVGDASRYLIASDPKQVNAAMRAKTACVNTGRDCPPGTSLPEGGLAALTAGIGRDERGPSVVDRWTAYQKDRDRVVSLADTGRRTSAVGVLTGISQGGAAIDFYYFNVAMTRITGQRRAAFEAAFAATRSDLGPWQIVPPVVLGLAMLLVLAGVRPRLSEYR